MDRYTDRADISVFSPGVTFTEILRLNASVQQSGMLVTTCATSYFFSVPLSVSCVCFFKFSPAETSTGEFPSNFIGSRVESYCTQIEADFPTKTPDGCQQVC